MDPTYVLRTALSATAIAPANLHRMAWHAASATNFVAWQRELVARLDAPDDLVELYATLTEPLLRAAFLARPTPPGTRRPATDYGTRASTLAAAIKANPTDLELRVAAMEVFTAKPTRTVAEALLHTHDKGFTPQCAATLVEFTTKHQTWTVLSYLDAVTAHRLIEQFPGSDIAVSLCRFAIDDDLALSVFRRRLPILESRFHTVAHFQAVDAVRNLLAGRPENVLEQALNGLGTGFPKVRETIERNAASWTRVSLRAFATFNATPAAEDMSGATDLELKAAAFSSDPSVLSAVVTVLVADTSSNVGPAQRWAEAFPVLVANPALATQDMRRLVKALPGSNFVHRTNGLDLPDVTTRYPDDDVVRQGWADTFPIAQMTRHGLSAFGSPADVARRLPQWARDYDTFTLACRVGLPAEVLRLAPVNVVHQMCDKSGTVVAELLSELGNNVNAWTTYTELCKTFTGTFGELIDTCLAVAA